MKKNARKYLVLGQNDNDEKPFICYRAPSLVSPGIDDFGNNQYSAENCLCSRKEARRTIRMLSSNFPETSYALKKFLD